MKKLLFIPLLFFILYSVFGQGGIIRTNPFYKSASITSPYDVDVVAAMTANNATPTTLGTNYVRYASALTTFYTFAKSINKTKQSNFCPPHLKCSYSQAGSYVLGVTYHYLFTDSTHQKWNFMNAGDLDTCFRLTPKWVAYYSFTKRGIYIYGGILDTHFNPYVNHIQYNSSFSSYAIMYATPFTSGDYNNSMGCYASGKYDYVYAIGSGAVNVTQYDAAGVYPPQINISSVFLDQHIRDVLLTNCRPAAATEIGYYNNARYQTNATSGTLTSALNLNMWIGGINNSGAIYKSANGTYTYNTIGAAVTDTTIYKLWNQQIKILEDKLHPQFTFVGASVTAGAGGGPSDVYHRWTTVLCESLHAIENNQALSGARMQSTMDNSDSAHACYHTWTNAMSEYRIVPRTRTYQYLFLQDFGWNDIALSTLTDSARFLAQYLDVGARIVAQGYTPSDVYISNILRMYQDRMPGNCSRLIFNSFQNAIKTVCTTYGFNYIDLYNYMVANDTNNTWNINYGNYVHLTDIGNAAVAAYYQSIIKLHY